MEKSDVKDLVRHRYGTIARDGGNSGCCAPASPCCGSGEAPPAEQMSRRMGYSDAEIAAAPSGANLGLGCGNPQGIAGLKPGETVVDLGSGAGFDCFLAARQVGPQGRVIGVDMTHEMLGKARGNVAKMGAANIEFRLGEIEHLPVADNTVDVVISNCVVNLSPDKPQVFREAFRVLKRGGRIAISDVVNVVPLPDRLAADRELLCGCVTGAASSGDIERWLSDAGFIDVRVEINPESREFIKDWAPGSGIESFVLSAMITGLKP